MQTILDMTAVELARGVREGDIKALDATEAYLSRIREVDPSVGAYLCVLEADCKHQRRHCHEERQLATKRVPTLALPSVQLVVLALDSATCHVAVPRVKFSRAACTLGRSHAAAPAAPRLVVWQRRVWRRGSCRRQGLASLVRS